MTNPKENTDLREKIADKLHELRRSIQRDPLSTTSTEWAIQDIEELVHQARVEELKRIMKGDKTVTRYVEDVDDIVTYIFSAAEIADRIKELESKEESI